MKVTHSISLDLDVLNKLYEVKNRTGKPLSVIINDILREYFMMG